MSEADRTTEPQALPGPWASDESGVWAEDPPDGGDIICNPPDPDCEESLARWPAHRRLIAAAPDLLASLKEMGDWLAAGLQASDEAWPDERCLKHTEEIAARARAAVDKAEGRS